MGKYVTPQGVVIEMDAESAEAVGFRPAPKKSDDDQPAKRGPGRPRKSE